MLTLANRSWVLLVATVSACGSAVRVGSDDDATASGASTAADSGSADTGGGSATTGGGSTGGGTATGGSTATGGATSVTTGDSGDSSGGVRLDVGTATSAGSSGGEAGGNGCQKVDFLFVIDNSGSMEDEQNQLIASFPGFIDAIRQTVTGQDFHLMVLTSDPRIGNLGGGTMSGCSENNCTCSPAPECCEPGGPVCEAGPTNVSCNGFPCESADNSTPCDFEFGAGQRVGLTELRECLPAGQHYIDSNASAADLDALFTCLGNVGTYGGGDERPMAAITAGGDAARNGPGGCNEGFLRSDAVLVVTFITDEEDDNAGFPPGLGSPGEPSDWAAALLAAKSGDPNAVVVLGLFGDGDQPGAVCAAGTPELGAEPAPRLRSFVSMFPYGRAGSICAADYSPFFLDAVSVIDTACDTFIPPG